MAQPKKKKQLLGLKENRALLRMYIDFITKHPTAGNALIGDKLTFQSRCCNAELVLNKKKMFCSECNKPHDRLI